jgi:L-aminopeptidase/D-esterase-like protein
LQTTLLFTFYFLLDKKGGFMSQHNILRRNILLPDGIQIGHADNGVTGVTVILCPDGAVGGVDVRGCAPGTRETDLLRPEKAIEEVHAVVFTGGSAYGLGACDGVLRYLREKGKGFKTGALSVPLVAGAVIFDLKNDYAFPDAETGYKAAAAAKNPCVAFGSVGAGTGATAGKILGAAAACKGGVGAATCESGGLFVTAVTVVNALGDIYDPKTGQIVAGARTPDDRFLNTQQFIASGGMLKLMKGANTTLSCVITNAKLTKLAANKLASIAHDGFALAIRPVHTDYDGDTVFALSRGGVRADFTMLSCMATEAVVGSILNAVK